MATIAECLLRAAQLAGVSDSPRLDLEVLLAAALGRDRTYLYTWPQRPLSDAQQALFDMHLARRREGCPIAYITGEKEFWSLSLKVDSHTLIPRPETELLVERALQLLPPGAHAVADLGTGSGAIALALASERPRWQLLALDKSAAALALAESNRRRLGRENVTVLRGDWLAGVGAASLDMAVANPPYIDAGGPHLRRGDVRFEPRSALVAAACGLGDIICIAGQARTCLKSGGWLLLEHGFEQGARVREILRRQGFAQIQTQADMAGLDRITEGRAPG